MYSEIPALPNYASSGSKPRRVHFRVSPNSSVEAWFDPLMPQFAERRRMHVDAIYMIEPKQELTDLLRDKTDEDFAGFMSNSTCMHSDEGGRTAWAAADYVLRVKLVFLCSLLDYSPLSEPEGFRAVFGNTLLNETLFDRWWTINRFEYDHDRSALEKEHSATIARLDPTSNDLVNQWIERHRISERHAGQVATEPAESTASDEPST